MLALLGLLPAGSVVEGRASFGGKNLLRLRNRELRTVSGRDIGMVFQDPMTSLHPMLSIGRQLTEHVRRHLGVDREAATRARANCWTTCAFLIRRARCARIRTSSRAACASASRSRSRSRADRDC